uniref:Uncharacterized protein n=1 Tax=Anopheles coluzzii TaxID=1518534 RepID=A0A8W7Q4S8_ANOCL
MQLYQGCLFLLFGVWWISFVTSDMRLYPIVTHYDIQANQKYGNCSIQELGEVEWNKTYVIELQIYRTLQDLKAYFSLSVRALDGLIKNSLLSRWIDGCEFVRQPYRERLMKTFYDTVQKNSKIPRCPLKPGDIMILNITPSALPIPALIPETDFLIEAKTYTRARTELILETHWEGSLMRPEKIKKGGRRKAQ